MIPKPQPIILIGDCSPGDFDGNSFVAILEIDDARRAELLNKRFRAQRLGGEAAGVAALVLIDDDMSGIILSDVRTIYEDDDPRSEPGEWTPFRGEIPDRDNLGRSVTWAQAVVRTGGIAWQFLLGEEQYETPTLPWERLERVAPVSPFRVERVSGEEDPVELWCMVAGGIRSMPMSREDADLEAERMSSARYFPGLVISCPRCGCISDRVEEYVLRSWTASLDETGTMVVADTSTEEINVDVSAGDEELWCDVCESNFPLTSPPTFG